MNNGWKNSIIQHDVTKEFPLPDSCIDVVITSPPYWGLRDYGVDGQIGLEKHPQEYIDKLVGVAREIKRVLKKSGSFYLNLGDTYFGGGGSSGHTEETKNLGRKTSSYNPTAGHTLKLSRTNWMQPKQLMLIPSRVAIALQDDGWMLRNDIIWHKPNPMPSSVKDRLNNTFEHVSHFVKSRKYYYDLDAIREPHKTQENRPFGIVRNRLYKYDSKLNKIRGLKSGEPDVGQQQYHSGNIEYNPEGKNPGDVIVPSSWGVDKNQEYHGDGKHNPKGQSPSDLKKSIVESFKNNPKSKNPGDIYRNKPVKTVKGMRQAPEPNEPNAFHIAGKNPGDFWDITTQPFTSYSRDLEHFAVFPKELIIKPLKASCPMQICKKCGKPIKKIIKIGGKKDAFNIRVRDVKEGRIKHTDRKASISEVANYNEHSYVSDVKEYVVSNGCSCNAGFTSGVVLDPFAGRGTVGRVAKELGLNYVLFDISPSYCELARLYVNGQKRKLIKNQSKLKAKVEVLN